ncbi:MAG: primosomal protein N' [Patescibacteria group bacterium]
MFIVDVIPIVTMPKNISQVLSYFSKNPVKKGALVSVPLGRRKINALVIDSYSVEKEKISIKKGGFQMKNIEKVLSEESLLSDIQIKLFKWFLNFYVAPIGLTAKIFLPLYVIKKKRPFLISQQKLMTITAIDIKNVFLYDIERKSIYEDEIKIALKEKKQVLFLVPDIYTLEYYEKEFKNLNPEVLSSKLSQKKYFDAWQRIRNGESNFIISTRIGLFINFSNLGLVIFDEEQDSSYKSRDMMPYYHAKDVTLKLAELFNAKVILGSSMPSVETYWLLKEEKISLYESKFQNEFKKPMIIDMRNEIHGGNYSILSYQLQLKLEDVIVNNKKAILFISRRGMETFVFCRDCGYIERCPHCESSLIHHSGVKSSLVCHYCGFKKDVELKCPKCQSHRIKYFGAGTNKAMDEILKLWPNARVDVLDSDSAPTQKEQKEILEKFKDGKINILVGTQLLFKKYNLPKIDLAVVLSIDNLLYMPDFRSGERIFQIAKDMALICNKKSDFLLQTYTPDNTLFEIIRSMNYESFFKNEILLREAFSYPPFTNIIKLIYKNKDKNLAESEAFRVADKINKSNFKSIQILGPAPAYIPKIKNNYIWQIIIKIKNIDDSVKEKDILLKSIPEGWIIDVNPISLL